MQDNADLRSQVASMDNVVDQLRKERDAAGAVIRTAQHVLAAAEKLGPSTSNKTRSELQASAANIVHPQSSVYGTHIPQCFAFIHFVKCVVNTSIVAVELCWGKSANTIPFSETATIMRLRFDCISLSSLCLL